MSMEEFRLNTQLNAKIVDGIIEGYKEYLTLRREYAKKLRVHSGFAFTKSNFIDHYVAHHCEIVGGTSTVAKAGPVWRYLQHGFEKDNFLIIVKNARSFDEKAVDRGKDIHGRTNNRKSSYMNSLMNININTQFPDTQIDNLKENKKQLQLELFSDVDSEKVEESIKKNKDSYERFYMITYETDENYLIESIKVWLPNPSNNIAYLVEDLTELINANPSHIIEMEEDMKDILQNSADTKSASLYDIEIDEHDDAEENDM